MLSEDRVREIKQDRDCVAAHCHTMRREGAVGGFDEMLIEHIDALLADHTALTVDLDMLTFQAEQLRATEAELARLRAAVAALAREFETWADTSESLGGRYRERAIAYLACASRAVGVAATIPDRRP